MEKLIKLFAAFIQVLQGERTPVMFEYKEITVSGEFTVPAAKHNISDVTFTNLSTTQNGTVWVNNFPLEYGQSKAFGCTWNERNNTRYTIRMDGADRCYVEYKTFHKKPAQ